MANRRTTTAILTALAARASVADALAAGRAIELEGEGQPLVPAEAGPFATSTHGKATLAEVAARARATDLERHELAELALDPPLASAILAEPDVDRRARAAELLRTGLASTEKQSSSTVSVFPLVTGLVVLGVIGITRAYVAPLIGARGLSLEIASLFAAIGTMLGAFSLHLRYRGLPWWVALGSAFGPGLLIAERLRRRQLSRAGVLRAIGAGELVGLAPRDVIAKHLTAWGTNERLLAPLLRATSGGDAHSVLAAIGAWSGAGALATAHLDGDEPGDRWARLARVIELEGYRPSHADLAAGVGGLAVIAAVWISTHAVFGAISALGGSIP